MMKKNIDYLKEKFKDCFDVKFRDSSRYEYDWYSQGYR